MTYIGEQHNQSVRAPVWLVPFLLHRKV
jgi:hypothetical protein